MSISYRYRTNKIDAVNKARKELWQVINTYQTSIQILIDCVNDTFNLPAGNCSFLEDEMIIMIENTGVEANITINSKMRIAIQKAVLCFYQYGYINEETYTACSQSPELLYNVILNHGTKVQIKL